MKVLEEPSIRNHSAAIPPRASLVLAAGEADNPQTEVWMGGAHSLVGETLDPHLSRSWVVDCAGDMPAAHRTAAGLWVACVFADIDGPLSPSLRLDDVIERTSFAARSGTPDAPGRIYVMCTHGMNRSGLVTGLLLRSLGVEGREAIDRIRLARPGALSNQHFHNLILYP